MNVERGTIQKLRSSGHSSTRLLKTVLGGGFEPHADRLHNARTSTRHLMQMSTEKREAKTLDLEIDYQTTRLAILDFGLRILDWAAKVKRQKQN